MSTDIQDNKPMANNLQYDKFEISDTAIIQKLFMQAIYAGKTPTPESVLHANRIGLLDLAPPKTGQIIERIESVAFVFDESKPATDMPCIIDVAYRYRKPKDIPLTVPVSRHISQQWNTARIGTLLEQILDQLRIGNTSSLRTDVLEPISKLAVQGITADAKELQALTMELASVKSANAIYEVENGRLMATITEERNKHELELRKEKAKAKSYRDQLPGMATSSSSPVAAFIALEEEDRFLARRVLLAAEAKFGTEFERPSDRRDYMLSDADVTSQHQVIQMYIHALCDAMLSAREQQRITLQMSRAIYSQGLNLDKLRSLEIADGIFGKGWSWSTVHPDLYEPFYKEMLTIIKEVEEDE